jgi:hypothetical protein
MQTDYLNGHINTPYKVFINKSGRKVIRLPNNKIKNLSRYLFIYFNDIKITKKKHIHHKDLNKTNDIIDNYKCVDKDEHIIIHKESA